MHFGIHENAFTIAQNALILQLLGGLRPQTASGDSALILQLLIDCGECFVGHPSCRNFAAQIVRKAARLLMRLSWRQFWARASARTWLHRSPVVFSAGISSRSLRRRSLFARRRRRHLVVAATERFESSRFSVVCEAPLFRRILWNSCKKLRTESVF